jgi:hypothetical protein
MSGRGSDAPLVTIAYSCRLTQGVWMLKIDVYTKAMLTIIAVTLIVIAASPTILPAAAQLGGCGAKSNPCYVTTGVSVFGTQVWFSPN